MCRRKGGHSAERFSGATLTCQYGRVAESPRRAVLVEVGRLEGLEGGEVGRTPPSRGLTTGYDNWDIVSRFPEGWSWQLRVRNTRAEGA